MAEKLTEDWEKDRFGPAVAAEQEKAMSQGSWRMAPRELQALSDQHLEFIEWLVDPAKEKGTQAQWARDHGLAVDTVRKWKQSRTFKLAWEKRLAELNVAPDRIQNVINAVYAAATNGDTKAASLYLQYVDRFTPKTRQVIEDHRVADMSDEELADELEATVHHLRAV